MHDRVDGDRFFQLLTEMQELLTAGERWESVTRQKMKETN